LIGMIEIRRDDNAVELGYVLARLFWGQGVMTEAAHAAIDWAAEEIRPQRYWAVTDVENLASMRVLEKLAFDRIRLLEKHAIHPNIKPDKRDCWLFERKADKTV
jgi:ribosomal-protein-alanine N-acetyltransferase